MASLVQQHAQQRAQLEVCWVGMAGLCFAWRLLSSTTHKPQQQQLVDVRY